MAQVATEQEAIFNTALFYGYSGVGKTSQIGPLALYIYRKYGLKTRYVTADGGGWRPIQPYIDAGLIEPLSLLDVEDPLFRLRDIANGYWPSNGNGSQWKQGGNGFSETGMYVIESLASVADLLKAHLVESKRKITQEVVASFQVFAPGGEKYGTGQQRKYEFGNASVSHYGFVQQEIGTLLRTMQTLFSEGLKQIVYGTLCATGEDDRGLKVMGPEVIGKALTSVLPARVGDLIYMEVVGVGADTVNKLPARNEHRAYITQKMDSIVNRPYPGKFRLSVQEQAVLRKGVPGLDVRWDGSEGYVVMELPKDGEVEIKGLASLWEWRDKQGKEAAQGLKGLMAKYDAERGAPAKIIGVSEIDQKDFEAIQQITK